MIYLDSAATSLQKPNSVHSATQAAMRTMASPGRGGHAPAARAAETVFSCRSAVAGLFDVDDPGSVVFTMNATHSLNIAINTLVAPGSRALISGYEHNAVTRPLNQIGAEIIVAQSPLFDPKAAYHAFRERIDRADVVVCTHVSNVFGFVLPIEDIAALCLRKNVPLIIDASQSAGVLPLSMRELGARFIAMPGHKSLHGPQGTGVLLCGGEAKPLMAGGTGSESIRQDMPEMLPDRLEAGTHNVTGIAGLLAGVRYVSAVGLDKIAAHERRLCGLMRSELESIPGMHVFAAEDPARQTGVLSVCHKTVDCVDIAGRLGENGVCVRAGLHCAPAAHKSAGTLERGTVRYSFSPFNTEREISAAARITARAVSALS